MTPTLLLSIVAYFHKIEVFSELSIEGLPPPSPSEETSFISKNSNLQCFKKLTGHCESITERCGGALRLTLLLYYILFYHSRSSSCDYSKMEIWAASLWQTLRAESEWFWAAFSTASVQVNMENVKPNILSLIFSSWNSLYAKNENYKT